MYIARFYKLRQKCRFRFFQVRCAHKSGDVLNFIIVGCRISSRLKWYKNCENRLRLAKVIVKNKMSRFYGSLCILYFSDSFLVAIMQQLLKRPRLDKSAVNRRPRLYGVGYSQVTFITSVYVVNNIQNRWPYTLLKCSIPVKDWTDGTCVAFRVLICYEQHSSLCSRWRRVTARLCH